jgi:hypothetical protein
MATMHASDDLRRHHRRSSGAAQVAWRLYQAEVERLMAADVPFAQVEDVINDTELRDDAKSALWLLAWSLREPSLQLRDARVTVAMIATHGG